MRNTKHICARAFHSLRCHKCPEIILCVSNYNFHLVSF